MDMVKLDRVVYHIGTVALMIGAFCWGWHGVNCKHTDI